MTFMTNGQRFYQKDNLFMKEIKKYLVNQVCLLFFDEPGWFSYTWVQEIRVHYFNKFTYIFIMLKMQQIVIKIPTKNNVFFGTYVLVDSLSWFFQETFEDFLGFIW